MNHENKIILIPWVTSFLDFPCKRRLITITESMYPILKQKIDSDKKRSLTVSEIELISINEKFTTYESDQKDCLYRDIKDFLFESIEKTSYQQWVFSENEILIDFLGFFNPYDGSNIKYLKPETIQKPHILTVYYEKEDRLIFDSPMEGSENIICLQ